MVTEALQWRRECCNVGRIVSMEERVLDWIKERCNGERINSLEEVSLKHIKDELNVGGRILMET